jgi:hypothetical protein
MGGAMCGGHHRSRAGTGQQNHAMSWMQHVVMGIGRVMHGQHRHDNGMH